MKAEYDIIATITIFCLLEKRSYISFGLPSIISTSATSSFSLRGVSTESFAHPPSPLSGGFPRRFSSSAVSSLFEHGIEGTESAPRVLDAPFSSFILSWARVAESVDDSMSVELELLAVSKLFTTILWGDTCSYGWILRAVDLIAGHPTSYSSPGNDAVTKFITFSTNMNRSPYDGSVAEDRKKTRPNPMDPSSFSSVLDYGIMWRQSAGGACFSFPVFFFLISS